MSVSKLTERIEAAKQAGRKALIPFLPGGYPDRKRFWLELAALDANGADVIEIGVPFSDPVADGPVVEAASLSCLDQGVTLAWILDELRNRQGRFKAPLVLMGYMNPFLQYGLDRLAKDAADAGVSGLIIPDLPFEEAREMRTSLAAKGIDLIPLVGLNTPVERMEMYAAEATGFVYFVSVLGTTGVRKALPTDILAKLAEARRVFSIPLALGFGISSPDQLGDFEGLIDGVVFGSSLIRHLDEGGDAAQFMSRWK